MPPQRVAVAADVPAIRELMRASVLDLFPAFYDARQTASAAVHIAHLDVRLVEDGTYYVHTVDDEWSRAAAGAGGASSTTVPAPSEDDDRLLDPATEPARVRAMFVRSDWTRRGLGRATSDSCERAARAEGFTELVLGATLAGVPLYSAFGFREIERGPVTTPDGVTVDVVTMKRAIAAA